MHISKAVTGDTYKYKEFRILANFCISKMKPNLQQFEKFMKLMYIREMAFLFGKVIFILSEIWNRCKNDIYDTPPPLKRRSCDI